MSQLPLSNRLHAPGTSNLGSRHQKLHSSVVGVKTLPRLSQSIHSKRTANKSRHLQRVGAASTDPVSLTDTGGGGDEINNNGKGFGGDGDGGSPGGSSNNRGAAEAVLVAAGKSLESLPAQLADAVRNGQVSAELMRRYLELEKNAFLGFFLKFAGMRERLLGDPGFPVKVAIEVGIGMTMKILAEYNKRGAAFPKELDFVLANVIMALIADFMLVWLPAPRAGYAAQHKQQNALSKWFNSCPDNAFQVVPAGRAPFTPGQRVGAVVRNGGKLLGVGFGSSLTGVAVTNTLLGLRQMIDPSFTPPNKPQGVLVTSAAYGSFMSWNSNLRYQVIAGIIEERGIERLFAGNQALCGFLSLAVRTGNTFLGSCMWVDYLRFLGLQKAPAAEA